MDIIQRISNLSQGRLGRIRYFSYLFLVSVSFFVIMYFIQLLFNYIMGDERYLFFALYFFIFTILAIRRFHDLNFSGWWAFAPTYSATFSLSVFLAIFSGYLMPVFTPAVSLLEAIGHLGGASKSSIDMFVFFGGPIITAATIFALILIPGTHGPNRFGEA